MTKDDLVYGLASFIVGFIISFLVVNWLNRSAPGPTIAQNAQQSGVQNKQLPPGHPPIDGEPAAGGGVSAEGVPIPPIGIPIKIQGPRIEDENKNIRELKGLPADQLQSIMQHFAKSLGVDCSYCHIQGAFEKDDKPAKLMARKMIKMVADMNKNYLGGAVTCFTCHQGSLKPKA